MNNSPFNVLIVGAGSIGAFYDSPQSEYVLTHAHGFSAHPGCNLLGFVDTDLERAQTAAELWRCKAFISLEEAFEREQVDIACIAVPDEMHYPLLRRMSTFPVKAVFTEKPLTKTVRQAEEIVAIYESRIVPVCVNYRRSFVPEFETLRDEIKRNTFGNYLTGSGYYGKGLLHNGSHLLHLLRFLIGDIVGCKIIGGENDFYADDPSISATLTLSNSKLFNLHHINCNHFTLFELDLIFEAGRVRITDTGFNLEYYGIVQDEVFKGYNVLATSAKVSTSIGKSLYYSASNIYKHLTHKEPLKCSLHDAFRIMLVCDEIQSSSRCSVQSVFFA